MTVRSSLLSFLILSTNNLTMLISLTVKKRGIGCLILRRLWLAAVRETTLRLYGATQTLHFCLRSKLISTLFDKISNITYFFSSKNGRIEKNCLEQHLSTSPPVPPTSPNLSPRPDFADINFIPNALINTDDPSFIPRSLLGIDMTDYWKDAKTPNINVLAPQLCEPKPNNLIKFDSEKFSPTNRKMPTASNATPRSKF